jgi:hypothetical protein
MVNHLIIISALHALPTPILVSVNLHSKSRGPLTTELLQEVALLGVHRDQARILL